MEEEGEDLVMEADATQERTLSMQVPPFPSSYLILIFFFAIYLYHTYFFLF